MQDIHDIERKVITALASVYNKDPEDITPSSRIIEDLEADSLSFLETTILIENTWPGLEVSDDESYKINTVGDIITMVRDKLREQNLHAVT